MGHVWNQELFDEYLDVDDEENSNAEFEDDYDDEQKEHEANSADNEGRILLLDL